jgi:hypothetical protein
LGCQFPVRNTKWLKNGKLRKAILSAFYNISQRNFGILLILWCSFKLWWNFCLDQNLVYNANVHWNRIVNRSYYCCCALNKCINFALCTRVCSNFDSCAILNSQAPKIFCL